MIIMLDSLISIYVYFLLYQSYYYLKNNNFKNYNFDLLALYDPYNPENYIHQYPLNYY